MLFGKFELIPKLMENLIKCPVLYSTSKIARREFFIFSYIIMIDIGS